MDLPNITISTNSKKIEIESKQYTSKYKYDQRYTCLNLKNWSYGYIKLGHGMTLGATMFIDLENDRLIIDKTLDCFQLTHNLFSDDMSTDEINTVKNIGFGKKNIILPKKLFLNFFKNFKKFLFSKFFNIF